ncbi:hypothetical protein J0J21_23095, partial [Vibrio vulnificus]|uniref:hypothetical protein n=1 Tax=Vibrio vulnificus TaxID=672 RepID=UPI0019D4827A
MEEKQAEVVAGQAIKEEELFVASCYATSICKNDGWLIDSGCTHHMTPKISLFKALDKTYTSNVRIGNGDLLEVKGKG